ncbi:hypothetical protein RFI_01537 [Reticulomyxa filosa]|uniref:Uncharacterized protein n=1 Tax=Reticulomyxa filosa TaxID=46433 RepID=X6PBG7_RETFI|nr:hypothetical protein RFI_01537 [Reticulomyxa filosa]|eukprot:ETO35526.1 hypothetical protein RFI_01537 [Reticulomyxa filosa]
MGLCCSGIDANLAAHSATIHSFQKTSAPKEVDTVKGQDNKQESTISRPSYGSNSCPQQTFSKEAVHVMYDFWTDHINFVLKTKKAFFWSMQSCVILFVKRNMCFKQQIGVLLYSHLFCNLVHSRQIFLSCGTIESVGWKLLDHVRLQMIRILHEHPENEWIKELQQLGSTHRQWGIRYGNYQQFLQALHSTFEEHFQESKVYSLRIKYSLENIFTNAAVTITGQNFSILFRDRVDDFLSLEFLDSLEICLSHATGMLLFFFFVFFHTKRILLYLLFVNLCVCVVFGTYIGREYFNRYLEQSFCTEYVVFLRSVNKYSVSSYDSLITIANMFICSNFFENSSNQHYISLLKSTKMVKSPVMNYHWGIEQDIWPNFVAAIHSIKEITRPQSI